MQQFAYGSKNFTGSVAYAVMHNCYQNHYLHHKMGMGSGQGQGTLPPPQENKNVMTRFTGTCK